MSTVVILYSKYSQRSIDLVQSVEGVLEFRKICIDNENLRREIQENKKGVTVAYVPCIFIVHANGNLDKYEGKDAFTWVHTTLQSMKRYMTPPPSQNPPMAPIAPLQMYHEPAPKPTPEPPMEENNTRSMTSAPLVIKPLDGPPPPPPEDERQHVKGVKKSSGDSIQNMAAQLQAEREKEDENQHPNALSKIHPS